MPLREVVTIEPCEHGRYDRHRVFGYEEIVRCPGGRILTDPQALQTLLYDECGECGGTGWVKDDPECDDPDASLGGCPKCWTGGVGGSGRTPKDGVEPLDMATNGIAEDGEPGFWFPASMLDPERNS
jgi:hypothetical protein